MVVHDDQKRTVKPFETLIFAQTPFKKNPMSSKVRAKPLSSSIEAPAGDLKKTKNSTVACFCEKDDLKGKKKKKSAAKEHQISMCARRITPWGQLIHTGNRVACNDSVSP